MVEELFVPPPLLLGGAQLSSGFSPELGVILTSRDRPRSGHKIPESTIR